MTSIEFGFWLTLAGVVWAGGYFVACRIWPYTWCPRCSGSGRRSSPSGKAYRPCPRCKGSGRRVRTGRRAWNWLAGQADRAS